MPSFKVVIPLLSALITIPSVAVANTITFYNYGSDLMVRFTPNCVVNSAGQNLTCDTEYPDLFVPGNTPHDGSNGGTVQVFNPNVWAGNFWTYPSGSPAVVSVTGEVSFQPGMPSCYDVSTIVVDQMGEVTPENGLHFFSPVYGTGVNGARISGCLTFPCPYCYSNNTSEPGGRSGNHTCCTDDTDLFTYLGVGAPQPPPPPGLGDGAPQPPGK